MFIRHCIASRHRLRITLALLSGIAALAPPLAQSAATPADAQLVEQGRRIYQEGVLGSGKPLIGARLDNVKTQGPQAACVNCHRPSGMGSVEGDVAIQPITGNYLFHPDKFQVATMDPRSGKRFSQTRPAYTRQSLAKTLRTGVNSAGRKMIAMMPAYALDEKDMAALIAYLAQLSAEWSPGASDKEIRLATVITPGVEPERRQIFTDMLRTAVTHKNASTATPWNAKGRRHMTGAADMVLGTERKWTLDVWELQGAPESWPAQLDAKYQAQPVFALLSGLSDSTWEPMHDFCDRSRVPCWFPSVPAPGNKESFYALYFSRGVLLEADVLAKYLDGAAKPKRVVQLRRDDVPGIEAAKRLAAGLAAAGIASEERVFKAGDPASVQQALAGLTGDDVLVSWAHRADLKEFGNTAPDKIKIVYFSAALAGGEQGIPANWHKVAHLVYPYAIPEQRKGNLNNLRAWLRMKKLTLVDEPMQAESFFAVEFLTETLSEMLDNLYRDYLIERAEMMLSRRELAKSEQQIRDRQMVRQADVQAGQKGTSIYPRLGLAVGQHVASKGAYIVRFGADGKLVAESDWIIPN